MESVCFLETLWVHQENSLSYFLTSTILDTLVELREKPIQGEGLGAAFAIRHFPGRTVALGWDRSPGRGRGDGRAPPGVIGEQGARRFGVKNWLGDLGLLGPQQLTNCLINRHRDGGLFFGRAEKKNVHRGASGPGRRY